MSWSNEFPADFAPPSELLALVEQDILHDTSWGNDTCPSFGGRTIHGTYVRVWADHPDPHAREFSGGPRYTVELPDPEDDTLLPEIVLETDDVADVVALFTTPEAP